MIESRDGNDNRVPPANREASVAARLPSGWSAWNRDGPHQERAAAERLPNLLTEFPGDSGSSVLPQRGDHAGG